MSINGLNSSTLRLTGLASGLDTESIVKSLLEIDQFKVDGQQRAVTKLEWQGDAYRAVNLQIKTFREKYLYPLAAENDNMLLTKNYNIFSAALTSTTSAVNVTASSNAVAGSYTIDQITSLASAASFSSAVKLGESVNRNTKIGDLAGFVFNEETIDGAIVKSFSFSINDQAFTFGEDATVSEVVNKVNSNTQAGVIMSYSTLKQGFTITGAVTGATSSVKIENGLGNFFGLSSAAGIEGGEKFGTNAVLQIEGVDVEKSSNSFTIDGINYTLKSESATAINFDVTRDVDATVNKIVGFIDAYNELITSLQGKLQEEVYSVYEPLTDAEREKLTEKQAEQWDEKAKSGLLRNDSKLSSLISTLRSAFYTAVEGTGKSASEIGLNTGYYKDGGKITVNKEKLRAAIETNPTEVTGIFTSTSTATDASVKNAESGLMNRISTAMSGYVSYTTGQTLDMNKTELSKAETRLSDLEDWLSNNEEKYYARFSAMETALAKLNSQTSWISSLLGTMN
jgi:flagellar hook-associated protein 2